MLVTLMHNKLAAAFDLFDGEKSKSVDVKEIPTIIHSLNLVPTQAEIHDLITEVIRAA
jgi:Ca2+-binding EF-hand superfamily protein